MARSDEIFASPAGAVHPVHCLTRRDVALYKGGRRLASFQWHQATSIEVRFRGHKGDQAQQGSVIVRTRDDASGTRSGVGAGGGAVALMVELLSVYPTMPGSAPLSSYQCGNEVRVWRYPEPLRHFARWQRGQEMILAKSGSTHCVSVQPLRWRPGGTYHRYTYR